MILGAAAYCKPAPNIQDAISCPNSPTGRQLDTVSALTGYDAKVCCLTIVPTPIPAFPGAAGDPLFLILYGAGRRGGAVAQGQIGIRQGEEIANLVTVTFRRA